MPATVTPYLFFVWFILGLAVGAGWALGAFLLERIARLLG